MKKILEKVRQFAAKLFFILGIMLLPILVLDLIVPQTDYTMLWWSVLFSALITLLDFIFDEINIFREKVVIKRIAFFALIMIIALGTSWIMKIITTVPILLSAVAGCLIVFIPLTVYISLSERKKAAQLNDVLKNYNRNAEDR